MPALPLASNPAALAGMEVGVEGNERDLERGEMMAKQRQLARRVMAQSRRGERREERAANGQRRID